MSGVVTAPGKVFLVGEYAVLGGVSAVVAAVSRRASARFEAAGEPASLLIAEAVRAAREWLAGRGKAAPAGSVTVDSAAFFAGGRKLGLGSSAAAAVTAVAAVADAAGIDVGAERAAICHAAARAHRTFQGGVGSGADVAASAHGGLLSVTRRLAKLAVERLPPLPAELVVFSTESPSSTVHHVQAVEALRARAPDRYAALVTMIGAAAGGFRKAVDGADGPRLVAAVRAAHAAMDALGRAADVPIVTPPLAAAAAAAAELGGAAKPSGAGGGDVGVAFFPTPAAADAFRGRAPSLGVSILDVIIDPLGVAVERDHVERRD